jgi:hypothetical protein
MDREDPRRKIVENADLSGFFSRQRDVAGPDAQP